MIEMKNTFIISYMFILCLHVYIVCIFISEFYHSQFNNKIIYIV